MSLLLIVFLTFSAITGSAQLLDYDPELEVPQISFAGGTPTAAEIAQAQRVRAQLVETMRYWQSHGMPNPPDLQTFVVITGYADIQFRDLIQIMNPDITDIRTHVIRQYEALEKSPLGILLQKLGKKFKKLGSEDDDKIKTPSAKESDSPKKSKSLLMSIFDRYAMVRYGFTCQNFLAEIIRNPPSDQVLPSAAVPYFDNAFYMMGYRLDLSDLLEMGQSSKNQPADGFLDLINATFEEINVVIEKLEADQRFTKESFRTTRIVLLPRKLQQPGEVELSTLSDVTVARHEFGHHLVHSLAARIDRTVDEGIADYITASNGDNSRIGEKFAFNSAEVASRLENQDESEIEPETLGFAARLREMSEKGYLRDFAVPTNIDNLPRWRSMADPYTAGNPLRSFLWNLHEQTDVDRKALDRTVLRVVTAFGRLPMTVSKSAQGLLIARSLKFGILKGIQLHLRRLKIDQDAETKDLSEARKVFLASEQVNQASKQVEKIQNADSVWKLLGLADRPRIRADSVIPEFLRVFYQEAQLESEAFAGQVREAAEKAMNSKSLISDLPGGKKTLVFLRHQLLSLDPLSLTRIHSLMKQLEEIRAEYVPLQDVKHLSEEQKTQKLDILKRYSYFLDRLHEYERTGNPVRLFVPHPRMAAIKLAIAPVFAVGKFLLKSITSKGSCNLPTGE